MKKIILISLIVSLFMGIMSAQFVFYMKNGTTIPAKKVSFNFKTVKWDYKSEMGEKKTLDYRDVQCVLRNRMIMFTDSLGNFFQGKIISELTNFSAGSCADGALDAIKNVKVTAAGCGTGLVSFVVWPIGLVVAIVESGVSPSEANLNLNDPVKLKDPIYCDCYKKEAKVKKNQIIWMNWGMGTSTGIIVLMGIAMLAAL